MAGRLKIGLLGGSFDPVHNAHIRLALAAHEHLGLDRVELIPAAAPWQRSPLHTDARHRLRMLELALASEPTLTINPSELERAGQTYTIDTVQALDPAHDYIWILGADQLANFCTWHAWREILNHVQLAVAARPGYAPDPPADLQQALLDTPDKPLLHIPFEPDPTSATWIRQALARGHPVQDLLHPHVLSYIHTHHLYQNGASARAHTL